MVTLTEEEHHARAMLLGMVYWRDFHVYHAKDENPDPPHYLDPDTLQELSLNEASERAGYFERMKP